MLALVSQRAMKALNMNVTGGGCAEYFLVSSRYMVDLYFLVALCLEWSGWCILPMNYERSNYLLMQDLPELLFASLPW